MPQFHDTSTQFEMRGFSILCWFHGHGLTTGTRRPVVKVIRSGDWLNDGVALMADDASDPGKMMLSVIDNNGNEYLANSGGTVEYDKWVHLAVVYDHWAGK